jgi:hypothetical protein
MIVIILCCLEMVDHACSSYELFLMMTCDDRLLYTVLLDGLKSSVQIIAAVCNCVSNGFFFLNFFFNILYMEIEG